MDWTTVLLLDYYYYYYYWTTTHLTPPHTPLSSGGGMVVVLYCTVLYYTVLCSNNSVVSAKQWQWQPALSSSIAVAVGCCWLLDTGQCVWLLLLRPPEESRIQRKPFPSPPAPVQWP